MNARGDLSAEAGGIAGGLGPLESLEVRWFPEDRPPTREIRGPVEANFLWDARPAGDLIRMRLAHSDADGVSAVRVAMAQGLMVRRHSIPGVVSVRLEGTDARPEWVAFVDPPLPKDMPIEVEFWRSGLPGRDDRRWPGIDLPTASKVSGLIGFRRPSDWSGRIEPVGRAEPASEQGFAKAWGTLPDDGLTLAGAAPFRPFDDHRGRDEAGAVETHDRDQDGGQAVARATQRLDRSDPVRPPGTIVRTRIRDPERPPDRQGRG